MDFYKIILLISNLILVIAGTLLYFLGLAFWAKLSWISTIPGADVWAFPTLAGLVILVGGVVVFIALLGCGGAVKDHSRMLNIHSIIMLVLAAMSVAIAVPIFNQQGAVTRGLVEGINQAVEKNFTVLHPVEKSVRCCGLNGPEFYVNRTKGANDTLVIGTVGANTTWGYLNLPTSCCKTSKKKTETNTTNNNCNMTVAYSIGCVNLIEQKIPSIAVTTASALCVVACIELLSAVLGRHLGIESQKEAKQP